MLELGNSSQQTVLAGASILYNTVIEKSGCGEYYRRGTSSVKLVKPGRYIVGFSGNIAAVTAASEIAVGITLDGDIAGNTTMLFTPGAVDTFGNVSAITIVDVPFCCGQTCCVDVAVENISTQSITVDSPNLTIIRIK